MCICNPLIMVTVYIVPLSHLGVRSLLDNARLMAQQGRKMVKQRFPVKKPLVVNILDNHHNARNCIVRIH